MKKLFLIGLAAMAVLSSCSNDETLGEAQTQAIGFSDAFINNSTRSIVDPSLTVGTLNDFSVYGFTQNGQIFDGMKVTKNMGAWTYSPLQYWVVDNTYTFGAIAPFSVAANVSNVHLEGGKVGMTVNFTNTGDLDLLHAAPAQIPTVAADYSTPVALTFAHQLSKVKFSFESSVGVGYNVKVSDVKITNAYKTGTLTVATAPNAWSAQADQTLALDFGHVVEDLAQANTAAVIANGATLETYNEKLMIPAPNTAQYTVTFTAELFQGDVSLGTFPHSTTIKNVELKLGYCYDFKATLTHENIVDPENPLNPIEFTVDVVEEWNTAEQNQTLEDTVI